jgi:uncharacterized protein YdhG (YjbR/CyaY superfamily)
MNTEIQNYNQQFSSDDREIVEKLAKIINENLPEAENKIWHTHPVWFLEGNPIVGYSKQKAGMRLMFWSGKSFEDEKLNILGRKFQDASIFFNSVEEINENDLKKWLQKSREIQWDYKNIELFIFKRFSAPKH